MGYFANGHIKSSITITGKNANVAEYLYISVCGQYCYRSYKTRGFFTRNHGSTLSVDRDIPNAIVMYNFQREHRLIQFDRDISDYKKEAFINF